MTHVGERATTDRTSELAVDPAQQVGARGVAPYLPSVLLGAGATLSGVALTATSGWLVVRASERPVILTLLTAIVAVRTFGLARPLLRYVERLRSHDVALLVLARAREDVARRLVPLTPARLGRRGDLLTGVVDDVTDVTEAPVRALVPTASAAVTLLVTAGLTALVSPAVALVHVGLLLSVAVVVRLAVGAERRGQQQLEQARAEVHRVAQLVAVHRTDLLCIGADGDAERWLGQAQSRWDSAARMQSRGRALTQAVTPALVGVATAVTALVVAGLVSPAADGAAAAVSPAVGALLVLTPVALSEALAPLADAVRAHARAGSAALRLAELLGRTPAVSDRPDRAGAGSPADLPAGPVELRLSGVGASWPAGDGSSSESVGLPDPQRPVARQSLAKQPLTQQPLDLQPLDLVLAPGSRTLVTGANGTGKSTLLAVLARHLDPVTGTYRVGSADAPGAVPGSPATPATDVHDLALDAVRSRVAVVGDEPWVLATSLRENLRIARPSPEPVTHGPRVEPTCQALLDAVLDAKLVQGLRRAGLGPWWDSLPDGLDTRLGVGGRGVSGGERARLGLARALVSEREVLLLDEPVAHLDPATAESVLTDLAAATQGRTVVIVSHDAVPDGLVDHVVTLDPSPGLHGIPDVPGVPGAPSAATADPGSVLGVSPAGESS